MTTRIRIRTTMFGHWQWELLTEDGHVANESERFSTRDECEADAIKQDLPVVGLRRAGARRVKKVPWQIACSDADLWTWQQLDAKGILIQQSTHAFLAEEDCIADARRHGFPGESCVTKRAGV